MAKEKSRTTHNNNNTDSIFTSEQKYQIYIAEDKSGYMLQQSIVHINQIYIYMSSTYMRRESIHQKEALRSLDKRWCEIPKAEAATESEIATVLK